MRRWPGISKVGRSVPAPGQGILTAAREELKARISPLLDLEYRRYHLKEAIANVESQHSAQHMEAASLPDSKYMRRIIDSSASCKIRDAQYLWGNDFRRQDPGTAPMRVALAVRGLSIDDVSVTSLHGTSTKASHKNESDVIDKQMTHLGRTKGNPLVSICQKYLTGHPKGATGGWMFNGGLQVLQTGTAPRNRNVDNVDEVLRQYEHLVYPATTINTAKGFKAFTVTSYGFGQKEGLAIAIAPKYLFATTTEEILEEYRLEVSRRQVSANRYLIECGTMHCSKPRNNRLGLRLAKAKSSLTHKLAFLTHPRTHSHSTVPISIHSPSQNTTK